MKRLSVTMPGVGAASVRRLVMLGTVDGVEVRCRRDGDGRLRWRAIVMQR
ncbi:hypothetical protein [Actinoplanes sp. TFC3]|nr:hypothetical protein [Actinoplanes sp. TFC3]